MLCRLRKRVFIRAIGKGRARRHELLFPVERHIPCGDAEVTALDHQPHNLCGSHLANSEPGQPPEKLAVVKPRMSLIEALDKTIEVIDDLSHQPEVHPGTILHLFADILKRVQTEAPPGPKTDALIEELTIRRDAFLAISVACRLPKKFHRQTARMIRDATPKQLADLRVRLENTQLHGGKPSLLLEQLHR